MRKGGLSRKRRATIGPSVMPSPPDLHAAVDDRQIASERGPWPHASNRRAALALVEHNRRLCQYRDGCVDCPIALSAA